MTENLIKSLSILLIFLLASCGRSEKSTSMAESDSSEQSDLITVSENQFRESAMTLGGFEDIEFKDEIQVSGKIDVPPQNRAVVSVPLGGYVTSTSLIIGDKVSKGQALLTLENPEFVKLQQEYLETKEQLRYLEAEYLRHQKLYEEKITSEKNFLKSESEYKTARAKYTGLKRQLMLLHISPEEVEKGNITAQTRIYAPIQGSISKMNITTGAFISPATEIFEIINTDHIHLELAVFEKDILTLKEGQLIEFSVPEASEQVFRGNVYRIGNSIDENRRVAVHGHIEDESKIKFINGMFVKAAIIVSTNQQRALPESAVVDVGELNYVLKLIDKTEDTYNFEAIEVQVLDTQNGFVAVESKTDFADNEEFLIRGAYNVMGGY